MSVFDKDEIWLTIERKRYPRSRDSMIEVINEELSEAGEFGQFEIKFYIDNSKGETIWIEIMQDHEEFGLKIDDKDIDVEDYTAEHICDAIDKFFNENP